MERYGDRLVLPAVKSGGWGLAYYASGELLSRIEPRETGEDLDTSSELEGLESRMVLLHTREATVGPVKRENTHPFRFQDWSFAHNGTILGFEGCKQKIRDAMPPFIERRVKGDTDSEHLFHLMLSFLYDGGHINRSNPGTDTVRRALVHAFRMADQCVAPDFTPSPSSAVVSDGYSLVAMSRGIPVYYALVEGISHCALCRPSSASDERLSPVDHSELRAIIVRSGEIGATPRGFQKLADNTLLSITEDQRVEFDSIG